MIWRAIYAPYGQATVNENPDGDSASFRLNVRFPGQYFDAESGLHYNFYRTYDPATGRYLEADPIGQAGGLNPYQYAISNPLTFTDPKGLYCVHSQSTGRTVCYAVSVESPRDVGTETAPEYYNEPGYSGRGSGRNNPDAQAEENIGPIPRGPWRAGEPYNQPGGTGRNTIPLVPLLGNECGPPRDCSSFRAHGNDADNDASKGCIILPPNRTTIPSGEVIFVTR